MTKAGDDIPNRQRRLVFFGDSICVGQGVSIHKGWVPRIAAYVSALVQDDLIVVNASVNGNTTRQALERMPYEVQSHGVDIMIVQFGMNDCNYWQTDRGLPRVSQHGFAANLEEIIARGINFGARTVILNTNHPTARDNVHFSEVNISYEESNRRYNEIIRDVARSMGEVVVLNDIETAIRNRVGNNRTLLEAMLLSDGLHLSEAGHDLYYALTASIVERAVRVFRE